MYSRTRELEDCLFSREGQVSHPKKELSPGEKTEPQPRQKANSTYLRRLQKNTKAAGKQ